MEKGFEIDLHIAMNTDAGSTLIGATVEKTQLLRDLLIKNIKLLASCVLTI